MTPAERNLSAFLKVFGTVSGLAIVAVAMPRWWMALCHEWLGLGPFPEGPIVEYLARSTSMFYALLGVLILLLSRDVRGNLRYIAAMPAGLIACGAVLLTIDLRAAMPVWWTAVEGPFVVLIGIVTYVLQARARKGSGALTDQGS